MMLHESQSRLGLLRDGDSGDDVIKLLTSEKTEKLGLQRHYQPSEITPVKFPSDSGSLRKLQRTDFSCVGVSEPSKAEE